MSVPAAARFLPGGEWVHGGHEREFGVEGEGSEGHADYDYEPKEPKEDRLPGRVCKAARSYISTKRDLDEELLRRQSDSCGFPHEELLSALLQWRVRNGQEVGAFGEWEFSVQLGLSCDGEGLTEDTKGCPCLTRFLNRVIGGQNSDLSWNAVQVHCNPQAPLECVGYEDQGSRVWVVALGEFQGGGLWIEDEAGNGPVVKQLPEGRASAGCVVGIRGMPVCFDGCRRYMLESWMGGDLWVVKAFTWTKGSVKDSRDQRVLSSLEFRVDGGYCLTHRDGLKAGEASRLTEEESVEAKAGWQLEFPHVVCTEEVQGICRSLHESASQWQRKLQVEIMSSELDLEGLVRTSEDLRVAMMDRSWFEGALEQVDLKGVVACVKALVPEVPLREPEPNPAEQFLQTRTVSLEEARQELELWKPPGKEEVTALEETTQAVERIPALMVEEWVRQGRKVIQVPGKAVLTRKAGVGKRRLRAVCCGNHIPSAQVAEKKSDLYAGGIDALTVRVVLAYTAQQVGWEACVVDVKTAFLYAPVRGSQEGNVEAPVIVVKPPYLLVQLGLLKATDRWRVRKALYGLQTSPRDWQEHRDKELRTIKLANPEGAKLHQGVTDESLWFIRSEGGYTMGLMIVYVDDIAVFGPKGLVEAVVTALRQKWRLSDPSWASPHQPVLFCGMELTKASYGWRVTQRRYLQELLIRYQVEGVAQAPLPKWEEPVEENVDLEGVRRAQGITGALLWAVTRSRPDLVFVVSQMGQMSTKAPRRVYEMGIQALKYASNTLDLGLEFRQVNEPYFGSEGQLSHSRSSNALEIYADASHSPGGERSRQCVIVVWKGSTILWEATRQPFTALSTAEAELIGMVHAAQVGECVGPIIEELVQEDIVMSLLGDNSAALASYEQGSGTWRNRHLRMRASAGREKVAAGVLFPSYVPGHLQVADVGTKPLPAQKLLGLLSLVNVRMPSEGQDEPLTAKFLARMGRMSQGAGANGATTAPTAVAVLLMAMSQLPRATSCKIHQGTAAALLACGSMQGVMGQPHEAVIWETMRLVFNWMVGLFVVLLVVVFFMFDGVKYPTQAVSPKNRHEPASSSWEGNHGQGVALDSRDSGTPPIEAGEEREGEGSVPHDVEAAEEFCVFPIIGRTDPRSNWVPRHFVRALLSLVGGVVFQYLGVDEAEPLRLREVARTFRYGVAFAYERARGINLAESDGRGPRDFNVVRALAEAAQEEEEGDDLAIDAMRHVDPREEWGPMPEDLQVGMEVASVSSSDLSNPPDSTMAASTGASLTGASSERENEDDVWPQQGNEGSDVVAEESSAPTVGGVSYRALDGALVVVYHNEELMVELPNWSFEEVHSIVQSIQSGDWSSFYEVMSWGSSGVGLSLGTATSSNQGIPPGEIAIGPVDLPAVGQGPEDVGNKVSSQPEGQGDAGPSFLSSESERLSESLPPLEEVVPNDHPWWYHALEQLGWNGWMIVSVCFLVGFCVLFCLLVRAVCVILEVGGVCSERHDRSGFEADAREACTVVSPLSVDPGVRVLGTAWVLSGLHRIGILLRGFDINPYRVSFEATSFQGPAEILLRDESRRWLWLFLVILFGLIGSNEAYEVQRVAEDKGMGSGEPTLSLVPYVEHACAAGEIMVEKKEWASAWEAVKICSILVLWEILRRAHRAFFKKTKSALSQTQEAGIVPMPLCEGIPNRAGILFSFSKAGYEVPIEPYPEEVRSQFHSYVGEYLQRQALDEDSSD